jgi:hypothetical protein
MTNQTKRTMMLRVVAPHFCAGADFEKVGDVWHITKCAPILWWMRGKPASHIKAWLDEKNYEYQWLEVSDPALLKIEESDHD